jgi:hypothetical protein
LNGFYAPNYHSISDFRKQNPSGLKTCSNFVSFLKDADLIGCEIIAIEQKSRAHNSKKANQSKENERHLAYIEERTQEYLELNWLKMIYRIIALQ